MSWGAIGARTTESQIHRQLALRPLDAGRLQEPHRRQRPGRRRRGAAPPPPSTRSPGVDVTGTPAILHTRGNPDCHVILRGGRGAPELHGARRIAEALAEAARGGPARAARDRRVARQQRQGPRPPAAVVGRGDRARRSAAGNAAIVGVMLESFLVEGRQDLGRARAARLRPVDHRRLHGRGTPRWTCSTSWPARCARGAAAPDEDRRHRRRADRRLDRRSPRASALGARRARASTRAGGARPRRSSAARSTRPAARSPRRVAGADIVLRRRARGALPRGGRRARWPRPAASCVVTDVGSTKRARRGAAATTRASSAATRWPAPRPPGVEHARADLFEGATWYLTPTADAPRASSTSASTASSPRSARARRRSTPRPTTA